MTDKKRFRHRIVYTLDTSISDVNAPVELIFEKDMTDFFEDARHQVQMVPDEETRLAFIKDFAQALTYFDEEQFLVRMGKWDDDNIS